MKRFCIFVSILSLSSMAGMFDQDVLKQIDDTTKDIINGYIRNEQLLLPYEENAYYLIPPLVIHLILLYYFDAEYFNIPYEHKETSKAYKVSEDKKTITKTDWSDISIFGNIVIPSTRSSLIYCWSFKILQLHTNLTFGITSDINDTFKAAFWRNQKSSNYGAMYSGHRVSRAIPEASYPIDHVDNNDIIKMVLDLKEKEIRYWVNDKNLGAAYTDIDVGEDIKYKMVIDMMDAQTKIQLIDYQVSVTK